MRAMDARTESYALDVEVCWGGELLTSEQLRGPLPYELCAAGVPTRERGFAVEGAWIDAERLELASVQGDHALVQTASGIARIALGERAQVAIGPLTFRIGVVAAVALPAERAPLHLRDHAWTIASCAVHALALFCMALMPPKASSLSLDSLGEDQRYARYLSTPLAREEPVQAPFAGSAEGARAEGLEGAAGKSDAVRRDRRLAVRGKDDERVLAKPVTAAEARSAGMLGVLAGASATLGPSSPFGPDAARGMDSEQAIGALFGSVVGDSFGFNGLGLRGTGRAGGGDAQGTIGVGQLGTGTAARGVSGVHALLNRRRDGRVPTIRTESAEVHGSLSKETIRRTIQRHLSEVRFCYEQALSKQPDLAGRVSVGFLIAPSGVVQQATLHESTLRGGAAECVVQAVRRWSFPAPEGGGYVRVVYPFVFESADSGS